MGITMLSAVYDLHRPTVSVVMPTYRRAELIEASIQTILQQTFTDFELIIQDDCSPDSTEAIVHSITDRRVQYGRNNTNLKMPENLNTAIKRTRGKYILVCHDHDLYDIQMIEKMVSILESHQSALYVHCGILQIDQFDQPTGFESVHNYPPLSEGWTWLQFMLKSYSCPVCANTMVQRKAHEQYGLYNTRYGFIADVEMWMRLSTKGDVAYLAEPLIHTRTRESDHEYATLRWDIVQAQLEINEKYFKELNARCGTSNFFRLRRCWQREKHLLIHYLYALKSQNSNAVLEGKKTLRNQGDLISKLVSILG